MARKKQGESLSHYFRNLFTTHPHFLDDKTNDAILAQFRKDHNLAADVELSATVRNNLANTKSVMRKKRRAEPSKSAAKPRGLLALEEAIDECLTLARSIDRIGLESIIQLLRRARNEVVWKMGQ